MTRKDDQRWLMAVYFPRGQKTFSDIKRKLLDDLSGVASNDADALAFVTNQELTLGQREDLKKAAKPVPVELYHLERITTVLDKPEMAGVRKQFLGIDFSEASLHQEVESLKSEAAQAQMRLEGFQTGGDAFCYWMLYHFDMTKAVAQQFVIIRRGDYPLYDVRFRIRDMDADKDVLERRWGELNSPADYLILQWPLPESVYYRVFFHARNGAWTQDLLLERSSSVECWLAATRVLDRSGKEASFEHVDGGFIEEFGVPRWRP